MNKCVLVEKETWQKACDKKMGYKQKLKKFIKHNRPLKLKAFIASHNICLNDIDFGHGKNVLHYCSKKGSPDIMRCLLRLDCDATLQDRDGNLPLHTALLRGLKEEAFQARETLLELVPPLLDSYPLGQDVENRVGVTGYDLLRQLKKKIKAAFSRSQQEESYEEKRKQEEEEEMWKEKLNKEAEFEFEEQHSRYDFDYDYTQEKSTETFDDWTERIRHEYYSKQKSQHHTFTKSKRKYDPEETSRKKPRLDEDEKLKNAREEMRKNFKPPPVENKTSRFLLKKNKYEAKFAHVINHLAGKKALTFGCIPWPCLELDSVADVLFCDIPDKSGTVYRKYLRTQQVRWHPDKFTQKFRDHLHPDHVTKIMSRVKAISQILNQLSADK
ncbi:NF-kappa-B inhibitor-like protein 1 isoform X2 [Physella acuta]|uniref:NF-kappa-B inhibitor-like protein 1 isoform X2 n=1 Tax=Physella acuta TaxID=109671 RepID=UPI0027DD7406|nr:NF-kappa-B inhibitor-like protein 1 isoform X2 [Physella acuta]